MSADLAPVPVPAAQPAAEKVKPRVWPTFLAFALFVVGAVFASWLLFSIWAAIELARKGPPADTSRIAMQAEFSRAVETLVRRPLGWVVGGFLNGVIEVVLSLLPALLSAVPWRERLRVGPSVRFPAVAWLATLLGVLTLGTAGAAAIRLGGWWKVDGPLARLHLLARLASPEEFALMLLALALVAGVGEELFFRGYLQTRLVARWGRGWGIVLASLAFGLVHFDRVHSTYAFGAGLFLGWVAERAGSIRPAMVAHVLINALSLLHSHDTNGRYSKETYRLGFVVGLVVFVGCVFVLHRVTRARSAPVATTVDAAPL